jgi:hypothetical protein
MIVDGRCLKEFLKDIGIYSFVPHFRRIPPQLKKTNKLNLQINRIRLEVE